MAKHQFRVGDRVAMSARWLKSTQAHDMGNLKGTIIGVGDLLMAVRWDSGRTAPALGYNLVPVERMHLEPV